MLEASTSPRQEHTTEASVHRQHMLPSGVAPPCPLDAKMITRDKLQHNLWWHARSDKREKRIHPKGATRISQRVSMVQARTRDFVGT